MASSPSVDKQKEKILMDAFREAIPTFMKAPFLHVQHTERPVGVVTKAEVRDDGLYIEANIFDHCTDVWDEIKTGSLSKYSIYGVRKAGTNECKLRPDARLNPCITKSLDLWSISVVGNNAINGDSYIDIVKSWDDFYKKDEILLKSEEQMDEEDKKEKEPDSDKDDVEKGDESRVDDQQAKQALLDDQAAGIELIKEPSNVSSIMQEIESMKETLGRLVESDAKVHAEMDKGEETMEETKKEEEVEKCHDMKKAEEVKVEETPAPEYISKADVDTMQKALVDSITKAFDERFAKIEASIEDMKKETVQKGGNVVVLMDELKKFNDESPGVGNITALGA